MASGGNAWASDSIPSMPVPAKRHDPILVSFGGMGFTMSGLAHEITEDDWESLVTPMYGPENSVPLRGGESFG